MNILVSNDDGIAANGIRVLTEELAKRHNVYVANLKAKHREKSYIASFSNPIDAFNAYKQAKETFIKEQANKWKDQIDPRAYNALINYQVEITD